MPAKTCAASHSPSGCNRGGPADPVGERRAVEFDALPCVDRRLPVERGMVRILGDQHVRQEPRTRPAALDRQRRHRRLVHALAGAAGEAGTDVPDHLEPRRLVVENFRDVLTDDVQLAAARRTAAAIRFMPALLPAANDRAVAAGHFSSRNWLLAPSPVRGRASPAMRRAVPRSPPGSAPAEPGQWRSSWQSSFGPARVGNLIVEVELLTSGAVRIKRGARLLVEILASG